MSSYHLHEEHYTGTVQADGRVVSEYTYTFLFFTSGARPTPLQISLAMSIFPGSPCFEDFNATAHSFSVGPGPVMTGNSNLCYTVTIGYSTAATVNIATDPNPTYRRTLWTVRPSIQQKHIIRDNTQSLIVNSAGTPFDGGIPVDARMGQIIANRNVDGGGYDPTIVLQYSGSVNSAQFLNCPPGTLQVDVETTERYEGAYHFWEETWTFSYNPDGHQPVVANAGFYQRQAAYPSTGWDKLARIQQDGQDVAEPEPLDATGLVVPITSRPGSCTFVQVTYFNQIDFWHFGLI